MAHDIQQTRYDRLMRRVAGIIGPGSKVKEVLPTLFPTLDVELGQYAELMLLQGTRLGLGAVDLLPIVGEVNHSQLFNPVGSGLLVVPTHVVFYSSARQFFRWNFAVAALTTDVGNTGLRDTRELGGPVAQIRSVQQAGGAPLTWEMIVATDVAGVTQTLENQSGLAVLAPGTGMTFTSTLANTQTTVAFLWRERIAEESELSVGD